MSRFLVLLVFCALAQHQGAQAESKVLAKNCTGKHMVPHENVCLTDRISSAMIHADAVQHCAQYYHGHLPAIHTPEKMEFLATIYTRYLRTSFGTAEYEGVTGWERYSDRHGIRVNTSAGLLLSPPSTGEYRCTGIYGSIKNLADISCTSDYYFSYLNPDTQFYMNDCDRLSQFHRTVAYNQQCLILLEGVSRSHANYGLTCAEEFGFQGQRASGDNDLKWQIMIAMAKGKIVLIGLLQDANGTEPDGGWRWASGQPLQESAIWMADEPNNDDGNTEEDFALLWADGTLVDTTYTGSYTTGILCEFAKITDEFVHSCIVSSNGYVIGSSCFFVYSTTTMTDWNTCSSNLQMVNGATPAVIYSKDVLDRIHKHVLAYTKKYWTGLRSDVTGKRQFVNGQGNALGGAANPIESRTFLAGMNRTAPADKCGVLSKYYPYTSYSGWVDCTHTTGYYCLGEIIAPYQKYVVTKRDMKLGPIANVLATHSVEGTRQCAWKCEQLIGCLGYNFSPTTGQCELLPLKGAYKENLGVWVSAAGFNHYDRFY